MKRVSKARWVGVAVLFLGLLGAVECSLGQGMLLVKANDWEDASFASPMEYTKIESFPAILRIVTASGQEKAVQRGLVVTNIEYSRFVLLGDLVDATDASMLAAKIADIEGMMKKWPKSAKYLEKYLVALRQDRDRFAAGNLLENGVWISRADKAKQVEQVRLAEEAKKRKLEEENAKKAEQERLASEAKKLDEEKRKLALEEEKRRLDEERSRREDERKKKLEEERVATEKKKEEQRLAREAQERKDAEARAQIQQEREKSEAEGAKKREAFFAQLESKGKAGDADARGKMAVLRTKPKEERLKLAYESAKKGSPYGMVWLCDLVPDEVGVDPQGIWREELPKIRAKAEEKDAVAQYLLGVMYRNGLGCSANRSLAEKYYRQAATQGLAEAQTSLAVLMMADKTANLMESADLLRKASDQGESLAQAQLGLVMLNAPFSEPYEAVRLFEKSMAQGNLFGVFQRGKAYVLGMGGKEDVAQGVALITKAADGGQSDAQFELGDFYRTGKYGLPQDNVQAVKYLQMASLQGNEKATKALKEMSVTGTGGSTKQRKSQY